MTIRLRTRLTTDLPDLARILMDQQPTSGYPLRSPLPMPVEEFIARATNEGAWVAESEGRLLGHVAVGRPSAEEAAAFAAVLGERDLSVVSALFVATESRGRGVGGRLLDTAVAHVRHSGRLPTLDVLPTHPAAVELYRRHGWRQVGSTRFDWIPADEPDVVLMVLDDPGHDSVMKPSATSQS